ncbi:hypothetical protein [Rhodanobacter sp. C05]|uniref:hypothetical protein n=1 Tax=Rhodanobacter sp. C05 TaxID=1945855 RepID=UPI000985F401|nr:hypothetical protein [Rhodanobacter sp. C05]
MLESIVSGLIVAAISGLAFLGYKHPEGYKQISKPLKYVCWAVLIAANVYAMGFTAGKYSDGKDMSFSLGWVTLGFMAFWIFLGFLELLPIILKSNGSKTGE